MGSMSIVHWMIVVGVVVLLFGKGKISGLMGDLAQGMKSFKRGLQEDEPVDAPPDKTQASSEILPPVVNKRGRTSDVASVAGYKNEHAAPITQHLERS